jgi:hypothetical protein
MVKKAYNFEGENNGLSWFFLVIICINRLQTFKIFHFILNTKGRFVVVYALVFYNNYYIL